MIPRTNSHAPLWATMAVVGAALLVGAFGACAPGRAADAPKTPAVVAVGKGSYASFPPADAPKAVHETLDKPLYLTDPGKRAVPTNHWWTNLLVDRYAGQLWAFPLMATADAQGLNFFSPQQWNAEGRDPISDFPISVRGADFKPVDTRAKEWGDWTLTFRAAQSPEKYLDVTLGRGLPYAWIECHGVAPRVQLGAGAKYFTVGRPAATLPLTTDGLGIEYGGRKWGVFAPEGTRFAAQGDQVAVMFAGAAQFLVVCPLPQASDLARFYQYAFAVPRDSRLTWAYDAETGKVTTTWKLTTQPLRGTEHAVIQGWLPHHYRETTTDLQLNGLQYLTPRGTLKCAAGTEFRITYPFQGFLPGLPAPKASGLPHDFDEARMRDYLRRYAEKTDYGADTYWGGKSLTQLAQYAWIAQQLKDPSFETLRGTLRKALKDWLTYTPGEKEHYFARYPRWRALVGMQPSYGSEAFNDHHFHYGYYTTAAAMLGMFDPQFLADYGGMARLVAKEYANWDRSDPDYPLFRTFDIWEGHSWAGGFSSPTGNNQESSSEAVQSWGGLFLLGTMLGDKEMTAAGAMGYAMETQATREYWFNAHGDNWSPNYKHQVVGMVWSGGLLYGTYFSGDPAWVYGIQWLPLSPMLTYLVRDPDAARKNFQAMLADRKAKEGKDSITSMGPALGNVILGQQLQFDPDAVCAQLDALWAAKDPVARENDTPGLTYYAAHANRALGAIQWDLRAGIPTSCAFKNTRTGETSYVVYNPDAQARMTAVYRAGKKIGSLQAPARALKVGRQLAP